MREREVESSILLYRLTEQIGGAVVCVLQGVIARIFRGYRERFIDGVIEEAQSYGDIDRWRSRTIGFLSPKDQVSAWERITLALVDPYTKGGKHV